ncbi:MAG: HD domain-containing protein [Clostridia bacterium]|nr:HD domain-containing protein [Clostridia bacterium]
MDNIKKLIEFSAEIDKMKSVYRRTLVIDKSRTETDAEHSWHLAMMVELFKAYAKPEVNIDRCIKMALVHDLVEIYAGDTFAYDVKGYEDKAQRELEAAEKLFALLPDGQGEEYKSLWLEFDEEKTPDALYTCALDRLQPLINNYKTQGHTWVDSVTYDMVEKRMLKIKAAMPEVWPEIQEMLDDSVRQGWLKK